VEGLKTARAANETITVTELADQLNMSRSTADKLLANGQVPGARRKTPGQKNSPWLIPADAVASLRSAA
ncbi:MAG: hypothetical protein ACRDLR_05900, partial [Gaiellaceae bacterium]